MITIHDVEVKDIDNKIINMNVYKGKTLLIVNVASACGFTPQYQGLQELYDKYKDKDFEILAFPCNQFGAQESGSNEEIALFCESNYQVSFKLFDKVEVNGESSGSDVESNRFGQATMSASNSIESTRHREHKA